MALRPWLPGPFSAASFYRKGLSQMISFFLALLLSVLSYGGHVYHPADTGGITPMNHGSAHPADTGGITPMK
jgi:hypothetical protein